MIPLIAGLVSGLLSAGSQVATYAIQDRQKEQERRYNSPAAQMQRLRSAGINPYGVQGQIAGQNTGTYPQSSFDFGSSFNSAVNTASQVKKNEMLDLYAQELGQKIKGLSLDNQFKGGTLQDKMDIVSHQSNLAYLNTLYRLGEITRQQYDNEVARINMEWEQYLAGIDSADFHPTVAVDDGKGDIVPLDPSKQRNYEADLSFKEDTLQWKKDYERFKTLKTEQDYKIACQRLIREEIAAGYESLTHMPFDNKDPMLHFVEKIVDVLKKWPNGEKFSFQKLWELL